MIRSVCAASYEFRGGVPLHVLFVCTANICRSAYAEVLARHLLDVPLGVPDSGREVVVSSAGTHAMSGRALNPDIGEFLPPGAAPHAKAFLSRRLTQAMVDDADLVLTAEAAHRTFLLEENPRAFRKILTLGQFAEAAARSDLRGLELVEEVRLRQPAARPDHDIADPYRRGRAANAAAAARIDELLAIVVPALAG